MIFYVIYYIVNYIFIQELDLKPKDEVTRSLVVDRKTWDEAMKYSRKRYKMSLSKVTEKLLQDWLAKERRKPLENENQKQFF